VWVASPSQTSRARSSLSQRRRSECERPAPLGRRLQYARVLMARGERPLSVGRLYATRRNHRGRIVCPPGCATAAGPLPAPPPPSTTAQDAPHPSATRQRLEAPTRGCALPRRAQVPALWFSRHHHTPPARSPRCGEGRRRDGLARQLGHALRLVPSPGGAERTRRSRGVAEGRRGVTVRPWKRSSLRGPGRSRQWFSA
jgi:hypothetical protein